MSTSTHDQPAFDPSRRRLCPDGACIGLLDDSGRCRECGLQAGATAVAPSPQELPAALEPEEAVPEAAEPAEPAGDFDAGRRLCPDGDCLGIIGANGRCTVCGRIEEG